MKIVQTLEDSNMLFIGNLLKQLKMKQKNEKEDI